MSWSASAAAENDPCTNNTEVIPTTVIVHFVKVDIVSKQRNKESEGGDESMPESPEKTSIYTKFISYILGRICARKTRAYKDHYKQQYNGNNEGSFHYLLNFWVLGNLNLYNVMK